jgi:hypothetical protein
MTHRSCSINRQIWILTLCLCTLAWPCGLHAQSAPASDFIFPRFVYSSGESTGIAIFNPSVSTATVTLTLRGSDGSLVSNVTNPATVTVPAGGQVVKTADQLFGSSVPIDASLEMSSSTPGLVAYYQTFDPAFTFLDGSDAPTGSTSLIFPVIPSTTEGIAEIDLVNPNLRDASADLQLWDLDGNLLGTATVNLPARGSYANLVNSVFPAGTVFLRASHIAVVCKPRNVLSSVESLAGTSLFAGFSSYAPPGGYVDVAGLNAVPLTQITNSGVIPYFHTGGQYASTLSLMNVESAAVTVTVTAVADNGTALGTQTFTLKSHGGTRALLQSIVTALGSREQDGWLLVQASGRVTGAIIYGRSDAASLAAVPLESTPKVEFVFPQVAQGSGMHTDLSLVNPAASTSHVTMQLVGSNGSTLAANTINLGPKQRVSLPLNQLLPEVSNQWGGILHFSADQALYSTASVWSDSGSIAANFTPQDTSFLPAPLVSFAVTGKVYVNKTPMAGFQVALSGPVSEVATSDQNGAYAFTNLPPGKYSLSVNQFGFQFVPSEADFVITNASVRQDFQGFTAGNAIAVQPAALPAGSSDTSVAIFGSDFNSTSQAFVGSTPLQTTFVSFIQLQAVLPAYMLATPAIFGVTVTTTGADGSVNVSPAFSFVAYQATPVLGSVVTSGSILENSPGQYVTLQGTGFLPGAIVDVNGVSDGIQVTVIDNTIIQAYLPASYFVQGGVYPMTVQNPYPPGATSNIQFLNVYYPAPGVQQVLPASTPAELEQGASPLNIDVLGYGFRRGAVVLFNGTPLVTSYCETDAYCLTVHLFATVPASMLQSAGWEKIEVQNPNPALASSQVAYLEVEGLQPTITSVLPGTATLLNSPLQVSVPIIVNGTNFGPDTEARFYLTGTNPPPDFGVVQVKLLGSTQLLAWVTMKFPDSLGQWTVEVANAPPGGGDSAPGFFTITQGTFTNSPFLISLDPQTVSPDGPSFTLTVTGNNLEPGAILNFNSTPLATTLVYNLFYQQLQAIIPASLIRSAGKIPITITNPDMEGTSNQLFLIVK